MPMQQNWPWPELPAGSVGSLPRADGDGRGYGDGGAGDDVCGGGDALEKMLPPFKFGLGSNNE